MGFRSNADAFDRVGTELRTAESVVSAVLRAVLVSMLWMDWLPRSARGGFAIPGRLSSVFANASR